MQSLLKATRTINFLRRLGCNRANGFIRFSSVNAPPSKTRITNFDKKILVWTGKYKTLAEVPDEVQAEVINKARSQFRIKYANWGMVVTMVLCLFMIYLGRKSEEKGYSLHQMNMDWHEEEMRKEKENSPKKS